MAVLRVNRELGNFSVRNMVRGRPGSTGNWFLRASLWLARVRGCLGGGWRSTTSAAYWWSFLLALGTKRQAGQKVTVLSKFLELGPFSHPCGPHPKQLPLWADQPLACLQEIYRQPPRLQPSAAFFQEMKKLHILHLFLKGSNKLQLWVMVVFFYSVITIIIFYSSKNWLFRWAVWETLKFRQQD